MSEPIIHARGLTKRFGDFTAVDDLTVAVPRGTIYAFLGANGSGKSTTIRMLIGLLRPTAGTVHVDGVDVVANPRRVRDRIGYMGQRVSLYRGLSVRENVEFYAGLYRLDGTRLARRWAALRERFDLGEAEGEKVEDLPAGVRQRTGLAVATLHEPRVLFLDEPTGGADVESRALFWEVIQEEAEAGVTVFVTTHFLEEADYCDWVTCIHEGRLVADGAPEALRGRHSGGYRVRVAGPPPARAAAAARLGAAGLAVAESEGGLTVDAGALGPAALAVLGEVQARDAGAVHVEQPAMADVFRRVLADAGTTP